jgi:hypothetical protein
MRQAVKPCEGGFVAAGDFREQLQEDRSAVQLPGRVLQRRVHHGFPKLDCRLPRPGHPALEGPYFANTDDRPKKFRKRHIDDDFLASGGPPSFETPAR